MRKNAGAVSARFDPMNNDPVAAEALLDMAVGNPNLPNAYLCCTTLHGNGRPCVYILHSMSKYTPSMDGRVMPWDSSIFCFLGDVLNGSALTVAVPTTLFMTTTGVKIRDLLGNGKGPLMEDGSPMCISFHVKGACYTNCRRVANHSKPLSATDKTMLSNWLVDQTAKRMLRWLTVRQGGTCPHTT